MSLSPCYTISQRLSVRVTLIVTMPRSCFVISREWTTQMRAAMQSPVRRERVDFPAPAERDDRREPHRGTVLQLVS